MARRSLSLSLAGSVAAVGGLLLSWEGAWSDDRRPLRCRAVRVVDRSAPGMRLDDAAFRHRLEEHCGQGVVREDAREVLEVEITRGRVPRVRWTLPGSAWREVSGVTGAPDVALLLADSVHVALEVVVRPNAGDVPRDAPAVAPEASVFDAGEEAEDAGRALREEPARPPVPPAPPRVGVTLSGGAHGNLGMTPDWTVGFQLGATLHGERWAIGLEGRFVWPRETYGTGTGSVAVGFAGGALMPCVRYGWFVGCVPAVAGIVSAEASDGTRFREWAVLLGARGALEFPFRRAFGVRGWIEGLVTVRGVAVRLGPSPAESPVVWRLADVTGGAGVDLFVRFR